MVSSRFLLPLIGLPLLGAAAVTACGDDETSATPNADGGSTTSSGGSSSGSTSSSGDTTSSSSSGSTDQDSGGDGACANAVPPNLDGGGRCGTLVFGQPAAQFQAVIDASDNGPYEGGTFSEGIYDAVTAERASGNPGSWRETFVIGPNNRFTRIRQVDTGSSGGPGETTYRSGTYMVTGPSLKLTFDCAYDDDAGADAASNTVPYEVIGTCNEQYYRYGAAGIRIWLKRR